MNSLKVVIISLCLVLLLSCSCFATPQVQAQQVNTCSMKSNGDSNCDNVIDLNDFEIFREEYVLSTSNTNDFKSDYNFDGQVNLEDFNIWRDNFNSIKATDIPTPTSSVFSNFSCVWCGSDCINSQIKRACRNISPPQNKSCEKIHNICEIVPSDTPAPSITYTPYISTTPIYLRCQWCGGNCINYSPNMVCPQVVPPEGKTCLSTGSVCEAK